MFRKSGFIVTNSHEEHFFFSSNFAFSRQQKKRARDLTAGFGLQGQNSSKLSTFSLKVIDRTHIIQTIGTNNINVLLQITQAFSSRNTNLREGRFSDTRRGSWGGSPGRSAKHSVSIWHLPGSDCSWPPQQHGWPCNMRPNLPSSASPHHWDSSPSPSTHWTQGKAYCSEQGCTWAQWERHSCRLRHASWSLWASAAKMICLLHVCIMPTVRRFDYGLRMWDTTVKLIWMEKDKHAIAMEAKKKKKNHNYQKNICDHKRVSCLYSPISPLASLKREENMREGKEERKKSWGEAGSWGEERDWDSGYF